VIVNRLFNCDCPGIVRREAAIWVR